MASVSRLSFFRFEAGQNSCLLMNCKLTLPAVFKSPTQLNIKLCFLNNGKNSCNESICLLLYPIVSPSPIEALQSSYAITALILGLNYHS